MDENKQEKTEEKKVCWWSSKKMRPDVLKWIIIGIAGFIVIILIFSAGIFIGGAKARFSYRWAENYHQNFAGPGGGFVGDWRKMPPMPMPDNFIDSRGAFGNIIKIDTSNFVIKERGDVEKVIVINDNTVIKNAGNTVKIDELKVGDSVVVIGSPNDQGQINAEFIRVFSQK